MKQYFIEFVRRGLTASGFGPLVLAVLYLILENQGVLKTITIHQVAVGIFSLFLLSFIAGGMNVSYQIERLPLMTAIFIHGMVLYLSYLATYLINNWIEWGLTPILIFSGIFFVVYLLIWAVIYTVTKRDAEKINQLLKEKQESH